MKKNLRKFIVVFVVLSIVVTSLVVPEREVKAQSYPRYSFSMSIKDGEACIVINGNHAYQLTKENTVSDGGFSSDCTLFLLFKNGLVFWYNYDNQGEDNIVLHYLDTNVSAFTRDCEDNINGYVLSDGKQKDIIKESEIKEVLENGDKEPVLAIPAELPTSTTIPSIDLVPTATPERTIDPTVIPTSIAKVTDEPEEIPEVTLSPIEKVETSVDVKNNNTIIFYYEQEQYILSENKIVDKAGLDNKRTVWIRYVDGSIYYWNHAFQKDESKVNLIKLTDSSNCLLTDSHGVVTAWYNNKAKKQKLLTISQIYEEVKAKSYKVTTSGTYIKFYIDNKKIDTLRLKGSKLTYHNLVIKNVKYATINLNGNVVIITKAGKLIVINRITMEQKTIKSGIKNFQYTSKNVAKYAVKKNGSKINLKAY